MGITRHNMCSPSLRRNAASLSAELVLGLMLSISRSLPRAHDTMKRGEWAKKDFSGRTLKGKILGIVGFGSVGQEVRMSREMPHACLF